MNKYEWLDEYLLAKPGAVESIFLDGALKDDMLRELCDSSYELVFGKLTKKLKREITGEVKP